MVGVSARHQAVVRTSTTPGIVIRGPAEGSLPAGPVTGPESHHVYVKVTLTAIASARSWKGPTSEGEIYAIYTDERGGPGRPALLVLQPAGSPGRPKDRSPCRTTFDVIGALAAGEVPGVVPERHGPVRAVAEAVDGQLRDVARGRAAAEAEHDRVVRRRPATTAVPYSVSPTTRLISDYGLINTTHHHSPLNASFEGWDGYWKQVRHVPRPPALSLANEAALEEFWKYNVDSVVRNQDRHALGDRLPRRGRPPVLEHVQGRPGLDEGPRRGDQPHDADAARHRGPRDRQPPRRSSGPSSTTSCPTCWPTATSTRPRTRR